MLVLVLVLALALRPGLFVRVSVLYSLSAKVGVQLPSFPLMLRNHTILDKSLLHSLPFRP